MFTNECVSQLYLQTNKIMNILFYKLCFSSCTSHDIPLQSLDARALLARTTESTPGSSLDLEWEHETLPISVVSDTPGRSW